VVPTDKNNSLDELEDLLNVSRSILSREIGKDEPNKRVEEISLEAERLRRKRMKKTALLSVLRGGSILILVLAFGLLQHDLSLYLLLVVIACMGLGLSTFLERGT